MKTLVQFETKKMDKGLWFYVTTKQAGQVFESVKDARLALQALGFQLDYSISRVGTHEVYLKQDASLDQIEKAILIK